MALAHQTIFTRPLTDTLLGLRELSEAAAELVRLVEAVAAISPVVREGFLRLF
jgi:hypothetical protein